MSNIEYQVLKNSINNLTKTINKGFIALNENLVDCAKSLRTFSRDFEEKRNDDYWHPVSGPNGSVPGKEYDWVLVKIKDIGINNEPYKCPHIAKFRNEKWYPQEWLNEAYGGELLPFEVVYWRPISLDEYTGFNILDDIIEKDDNHDKI